MTRRRVLAASAGTILAAQGLATQHLVRNYRSFENPARPPLSLTPAVISDWNAQRDLEIDPAALEMLSPDDYVSRVYVAQSNRLPVDLFVTYYKSQLRDKNAHSPKVCLPGSGWQPVTSRTEMLRFEGGEVQANYYVVAKGEARNLVLYWYQTHRQTIADEHLLNFHRVWNSIRENRTDMLFVRTISRIENGDEAAAFDRLRNFIEALRPILQHQFRTA